MRGTGYAIAEIIWWMLAAAAIGGIIGWLLRQWLGGGAARKDLEAKLEKEQGRYAMISGELGEWKRKGKGLTSDLEAKGAEVDTLTERTAGLEADLSAARADLEATRAELGEATARAGALTAQVESVAAGKDAEISRLGEEVGEVAHLQSQVAERAAQVSELESKIADLDSRLAASTAELADLQAQHAACGVAAEEHHGQIAALQAQLAAAEAQPAAAATAPTAAADLEGPAANEKEAVRSDGPASLVLGVVPDLQSWQQGTTSIGTPGAGHRDDLKVVSGIGPKLERVLNDAGIKSWEQLAALKADEVATLEAALEEFPGRIERDGWIAQAQALVARFPDRTNRPTRKTLAEESDA